jgi:hypothetical protein
MLAGAPGSDDDEYKDTEAAASGDCVGLRGSYRRGASASEGAGAAAGKANGAAERVGPRKEVAVEICCCCS